MSFDRKSLMLLDEALDLVGQGFAQLPHFNFEADVEAIRPILLETAVRMQDNFPYQHPLYAGQMLKPPHPIARLAYAMAQYVNPNNHALDGGRASSKMECEAVAELASMIGWKDHVGHLCSGGTIANMEAIWIASRKNPNKKFVASDQAHYTHGRVSKVLQLSYLSVPSDKNGRMDLMKLERLLKVGDVGTIIATIGSTALGTTDPLDKIIGLAQKYNCQVHVDAAYGGYFTLIKNLTFETKTAFQSIYEADSVVIDPHKHGLQPYGCGCVIFKDPGVAWHYQHASPYTYFTSAERHLGENSLECSRAGASAVALWATQKYLPLTHDGEFAANLSKCRAAALKLYELFKNHEDLLTISPPELDIVVWAPKDNQASMISHKSRKMFEIAASQNLHLALVDLPTNFLKKHWKNVVFDVPNISCLRSCLMKPEHFSYIDEIANIIFKIIK